MALTIEFVRDDGRRDECEKRYGKDITTLVYEGVPPGTPVEPTSRELQNLLDTERDASDV